MSILDTFMGKRDPDVVAAERRAYEDETKRVKLERKNAAIRSAARGGGGGAVSTLTGLGSKIMKVGEYGASLNWGNAPVQHPPARKGRKQKKQAQQEYQHPFAMPEFPF